MHREFYKDHTGKLHPVDYFKTAEYLYQCPPDPTSLIIPILNTSPTSIKLWCFQQILQMSAILHQVQGPACVPVNPGKVLQEPVFAGQSLDGTLRPQQRHFLQELVSFFMLNKNKVRLLELLYLFSDGQKFAFVKVYLQIVKQS